MAQRYYISIANTMKESMLHNKDIGLKTFVLIRNLIVIPEMEPQNNASQFGQSKDSLILLKKRFSMTIVPSYVVRHGNHQPTECRSTTPANKGPPR